MKNYEERHSRRRKERRGTECLRNEREEKTRREEMDCVAVGERETEGSRGGSCESSKGAGEILGARSETARKGKPNLHSSLLKREMKSAECKNEDSSVVPSEWYRARLSCCKPNSSEGRGESVGLWKPGSLRRIESKNGGFPQEPSSSPKTKGEAVRREHTRLPLGCSNDVSFSTSLQN